MNSTDIKLNLIIKNQKAIMKNINSIIKIMIKSLDLDPDLIQSLNQDQSDHDQDHDHEQSDEDTLSWFKSWLLSHGIDPEGRNFNVAVMRSVKYFKARVDELSNPVKYCMSFLPPVSQPTDSLPSSILGFSMEQIEEYMPKMDAKLYKKALDLSASLRTRNLAWSAAKTNIPVLSFATAVILQHLDKNQSTG